MNDIRYICISDTHFGADNSILTNLGPADGAVDPSKPSALLINLTECLRALIARNSGATKPTLILNGDIFEFALSTDNIAAMAFQRFLELSMPERKEDRLFDAKIIYIPGNHDHHLWESARELQYAKFIQQAQVLPLLPEPWHTTKMIDDRGVPSLFAEAVVRRCAWLSDVSVATIYPNLALMNDNRLVIFSHGHFTEAIYSLMSTLADAMFPERQRPSATWDWEAENFAWIDFFWSTMGRSGPVGPDVELIYEIMQNPAKFAAFVASTSRQLLSLYGGKVARRFGWVLSTLIRSMVAGRLERGHPETILSDNGKGLRKYLTIPVSLQLEAELKGRPMPPDVTFVFGHTHKPFEQIMTLDNFAARYIRVYNSGGWVVDRPRPQILYGGAIILLDENLDALSVRMYNETELASSYAISVNAAQSQPHSASPFLERISGLVTTQAPPWSDFSVAAAGSVALHTRKLAQVLKEP